MSIKLKKLNFVQDVTLEPLMDFKKKEVKRYKSGRLD